MWKIYFGVVKRQWKQAVVSKFYESVLIDTVVMRVCFFGLTTFSSVQAIQTLHR